MSLDESIKSVTAKHFQTFSHKVKHYLISISPLMLLMKPRVDFLNLTEAQKAKSKNRGCFFFHLFFLMYLDCFSALSHS